MSIISFVGISLFLGLHRSRGENHEQHREKVFQVCSSLERTLATTHRKAAYKLKNTSVFTGEKHSTVAGCLSPSGGLKCELHTGPKSMPFY